MAMSGFLLLLAIGFSFTMGFKPSAFRVSGSCQSQQSSRRGTMSLAVGETYGQGAKRHSTRRVECLFATLSTGFAVANDLRPLRGRRAKLLCSFLTFCGQRFPAALNGPERCRPGSLANRSHIRCGGCVGNDGLVDSRTTSIKTWREATGSGPGDRPGPAPGRFLPSRGISFNKPATTSGCT